MRDYPHDPDKQLALIRDAVKHMDWT